MKWKTIKFHTPVNGDVKKTVEFALFPTKLDDGYTVWLERYNVIQQFSIMGKDWDTAHWKTIKSWALSSEEPKDKE